MSLTRADLESKRLQQVISQSGRGVNFLSEDQLQESMRQTLGQLPPSSDVWIFAYGSLIWNPIFKFVEQRVGTIHGWHRRFCLWVPRGRGTPDNPGLVLGLDKGGSCRGIVYRIAATDVPSELLLVWRREMLVGSYIPRWVRVFDGTQKLEAIAFVINRHHRAYAGDISLETTVNSIATATGELGSCAEYLMQTLNGLMSVGIQDKQLLRLCDRVLAQQNASINPEQT
ncbi:MAG TPA: gamma-glutamylcyclotransferase [Waterburya sp.]|jgi:cation transport protein ChaC